MNSCCISLKRAFALLFLIFSAALLAADRPVTLQFQVRAQPNDAAPRCAAKSIGYCRDDLNLPQVFDELNRMVTGTAPLPFNALGTGIKVVGVQVNLGEGIFRLQQVLQLTGWLGSGRYGALSITGAGADKTQIVGTFSVPASAWRAITDADTRIPASAKSYVHAVNLAVLRPSFVVPPARVATGFGEPIVPVPLEVFFDDRPMTRARWPNTGWAKIDLLTGEEGALGSSNHELMARNAHAAEWQLEPDLFVSGYFFHDWAFERMPVTGVDSKDGRLVLPNTGTKFGISQSGRLMVENALNELDSPGEWYFDNARHTLYFWSPNPSAITSVEVSWVPSLLNINQSSRVDVQKIGFQGSTGDAVRINQSHHVSLTDAVVRNTGNRAVVIDGGNDVSLHRITMTDLGDGGVLMQGGDRQTLNPAKHVIEDCQIERFSRLSRTYRPAIWIEGVGNQVLRNRIAEGPHAAIIFSGNDHLIDGNYISDVVTETNDAGAIYTGRDWTARGTVISNNLLKNIYPRLTKTLSVMGVYLDDQASGISIAKNIFSNVGRAVFIGGGRNNIITDNLFLNSTLGVFIDNRGITWQRDATFDPNSQLQRNFRNVPVGNEIYKLQFKGLSELLDDDLGRSKYNKIIKNLFIMTENFKFIDGSSSGVEVKNNKKIPLSSLGELLKSKYNSINFEISNNSINENLK